MIAISAPTIFTLTLESFAERFGEGDLGDCYQKTTKNRCSFNFALLLIVVWIFFQSTASAQTPVSGAIAVNTHWTASESPYLLSGDAVVQNSAILTIDPGVTVYMALDSSLTVQGGGIQALGTSANPINVLSDKSRLAQDAAPGDWRQWVFNPGTTNTRLDHVLFDNGKGLVVKGSAPIFNYLKINNQQGAAITIDLAASPTGIGNKASGNTINAIAVPAGDIKTSVKWGLRGIPYIISTGVVSVGTSPSITSITPNVIQQGSTLNVDLVGTGLTGLSQVQFDATGLAAQIVSVGTDTHANLSVTAEATAEIGKTIARLLVDAGEIAIADAITIVPTQPILSNLSPPKLFLGQGVVDVTINGSNFSNQSIVQLNNTTIPAQYQSSTKLQTSITTPQTEATLSVKVLTPDPFHEGQYLSSNELILPIVSGQLALNPTTVTATKGTTKTFTLTLPYPAGTDGIIANVVSSVPAVGNVPSTITIPAGQTTATFTFTATDVGNTAVTVSKAGFISAQAQVTVTPPPTLTLTVSQLTLGVGRTTSVTLQSSIPAGGSGLNVTLNSSNTGVATVPVSITLPAGSNSATFTVTTASIGNASITASANEFVTGSAAFTVRATSLNLPTGALVAPGLTRSVPLTLSDPAPAGGLVVTLASSDTAKATVPATIAIPEGQTTANFTISGLVVGTTTINATAPSYQAASLPVSVDAITIKVGNPQVSSISIPADVFQNYAITLSKPAPAGGVEVSLSTSDQTKATVTPSTITIAEGQTSGGVVQANLTGIAKGTALLSASAGGLTPATVPVTITGKPDLAFSKPTAIVGKGLKTHINEVYIGSM
jgi:trimeric autotransporter adhesin